MAATVKTDVAQMRNEQTAFWNAHSSAMAAVITKARWRLGMLVHQIIANGPIFQAIDPMFSTRTRVAAICLPFVHDKM